MKEKPTKDDDDGSSRWSGRRVISGVVSDREE